MAPRTGERKLQILQTLASMLEQPRGERVTTAALAARLSVSEAALYRHFASKAQMFEGLIEFIEQTLFTLINKIAAEEPDGMRQIHQTLSMLLSFAEKNPGMVRVLIGDALVNEDERLQARINLLTDRIEAALKQSLRIAATAQGPSAPGEGPVGAPPPAVSGSADQPGEPPSGPDHTGSAGGSDHPGPPGGTDLADQPSDSRTPGGDRQGDAAARANLMMCYVLGRWHQYAKSGFKRLPTEMWDRQWPTLL